MMSTGGPPTLAWESGSANKCGRTRMIPVKSFIYVTKAFFFIFKNEMNTNLYSFRDLASFIFSMVIANILVL